MGDREKDRQLDRKRERQIERETDRYRDILQITGQMNRESEPEFQTEMYIYNIYL